MLFRSPEPRAVSVACRTKRSFADQRVTKQELRHEGNPPRQAESAEHSGDDPSSQVEQAERYDGNPEALGKQPEHSITTAARSAEQPKRYGTTTEHGAELP